MLVMLQCGLMEPLCQLSIGSEKALSKPAMRLLALVIRLARFLLPTATCERLLSLTSLLDAASNHT